jgi:hypothetical protein
MSGRTKGYNEHPQRAVSRGIAKRWPKPKHSQTIKRLDLFTDGSPGRYETRCDCGWVSPEAGSEPRVRQLFYEHLDSVGGRFGR